VGISSKEHGYEYQRNMSCPKVNTENAVGIILINTENLSCNTRSTVMVHLFRIIGNIFSTFLNAHLFPMFFFRYCEPQMQRIQRTFMFDSTFQSLAVSLRTTRFNIPKFYTVLALRSVFCTDFRTDSGLCCIRH